MSEDNDALWDPTLAADAELQHLQTLLAAYRLKTRSLEHWTPKKQPVKSSHTKLAKILLAGLAASLLLCMGHFYRLDWNEGQPWQVSARSNADKPFSTVIAPGGLVEAKKEPLTIDVARIGQVILSPKSKLILLETRANRHRVNLESGHLRAIIWAPPGYFGVTDGRAELIDLGCDFDLWKNSDGSGRVFVRSGWVAYRFGVHEVLVPAGFQIKFNALRPFTPMRPETNPDFIKAVDALEQILTTSGASSIAALLAADQVAELAQNEDAFTLLSLLTQHPLLAKGSLYPRLALALKIPENDPLHRSAWAAGNKPAINNWWDRYPTQPKNWWANWRDLIR